MSELINNLKENAVKVESVKYPVIDKNFLKQLRTSLNMSQSLFASYLGVTKKAVEKWEQGINRIKGPVKVLLYLINDDPNILSKIVRVGYKGKNHVYKKEEELLK